MYLSIYLGMYMYKYVCICVYSQVHQEIWVGRLRVKNQSSHCEAQTPE